MLVLTSVVIVEEDGNYLFLSIDLQRLSYDCKVYRPITDVSYRLNHLVDLNVRVIRDDIRPIDRMMIIIIGQ